MAAYVPQNIQVFSAVFAAAMAGMIANSGATPVDTTQADYAGMANTAMQYSQSFDTNWGAVYPNQYELEAMKLATSAFFRAFNFTAAALPAVASFNGTTNSVIAGIKQGDTALNGTGGVNVTPASLMGRNRAYGQGTPTTPGQATITNVGAAKLVSQTSGLFHAWCSAAQTIAAADVATFTVKTFTDTVAGTALTLANTTQVGFGTNGLVQPGNVAVTNNGAFVSSAGAGITITGGTAGVTFDTKAQTQGTAASGMFFEWDAIAGVNVWQSGSPTNEQIIPVGQTALAIFAVTNSVAARAFSDMVIGFFEMP